MTRRLPRLEGHEPVIVMLNDAVIQGLSAVPNMRTSTNGASSRSAPASAMRDLLIANQLTVAD